MDQLTYGVFRLGQIWSVVGEGGAKWGFTSREDAVAAALELATARRLGGQEAQVTVQDELGLLTTIRSPRG